VQKLRIVILAQVAWVLCGAAFLAATPTRAPAQCVCPNIACWGANWCGYSEAGYICSAGPGWCYTQVC
jgi:hypothetical protein